MKKSKILSFALLPMAIGMLASCGGNNDNPDPGPTKEYKVSEEEWVASFGLSKPFYIADNYKLSMTTTMGEATQSGGIIVDGFKLKTSAKGATETDVIYNEIADGKKYEYSYDTEGKVWKKIGVEETAADDLAQFFLPFGQNYKSFTYDSNSNSYKCSSLIYEGAAISDLMIKFENKQIKEVAFKAVEDNEPVSSNFEIVYGGQTVTLPSIPQEGVDLVKAKEIMNSFLTYFEKHDIDKSIPRRVEVHISDFLNKNLVPNTFETVNSVGQALMYAKVAELFMNQINNYDSSKILQGVISEGGMSMTFNLRFNLVKNGDDSELTVDISFDNPEIDGLGGVHLVANQANGALGNFELYSSAVAGGSVNQKRFFYDDLIFKQGDSLKAGRFIVDQDTKEVVHEDGTFAQEVVNEGHNQFMEKITPFVDYIKDNSDKIIVVDNFMEIFYQAAMYYQELINSYAPVPSTVTITLSAIKDVGIGNALYILSSVNDWDVSQALRGTWTEGNVWVFEFVIQANTEIQYKLAIGNYDDPTQGSLTWEADPNRILNESTDTSYNLTWQE